MAANWRSSATWRSANTWRGVSSSVALVIQSAEHLSSAGNVALVQHHALVVADAAHAQTADNVTLTAYAPGTVGLIIQGADHAQTADNVVLTQHHVLAIDAATHAQTADNLTLVAYTMALVIADAIHAHTAGNVALTQHHVLSIDGAQHTQAADNVAFTMPVILLRTPTVPNWENPRKPFSFMPSTPIGQAMLVSGATVTLLTDPTQEQLDAVDRYYLGGHDYYLEQAEADVLTAAGYGDYITVGG